MGRGIVLGRTRAVSFVSVPALISSSRTPAGAAVPTTSATTAPLPSLAFSLASLP